ncbi:MAG: tRNA lysidine(34) synthetase TilS [Acidobacteria bacterium]|nr:tRNA lysidine(34) synthetase TilS [Acidobacteriota bacterium]
MDSFPDIVNHCRRFIDEQKMLQDGDCVVAGISGGADSVFLFHVLLAVRREKGIHLIAAHLNHGLRPEAAGEVDFVREMCRNYRVPFHGAAIPRGMLAEMPGKSIEMAAREMRKRFLNAVADTARASKIALGHTGTDHVETMLMNIHRGTGLRGLSGIEPVRGRIIRPLIRLGREKIRETLEEHRIQYLFDKSNNDPKYMRNRVRAEILPSVSAVFGPGYPEKWRRLSEHAADSLSSLRFLFEKFFFRGIERDSFGFRVSRNLFRGLPEAVSREAMLYFLEESAGSTFFVTGELVARLVRFSSGNGYGIIELPSGVQVVRSSEWLYFLNKIPNLELEIHEPGNYVSWFGKEIRFCRINDSCPVPDDSDFLFIDENQFPFPFQLAPVDFEQDAIFYNGHPVPDIRNFLKKHGIGKAERDRMPVLKKGHRILWIPGFVKLISKKESGIPGNRIAVYFTA